MRAVTAFMFLALAATGCSEYDLVPPDDTNLPPDTAVDPALPQAQCSVSPNPVTPPFSAATFDGSGSTTPDGTVLVSYVWELLSAPAGSSVSLPYATGVTISGFTPDLAGDYTVGLTVTNSAGDDATCQVTLTATPSQDLWVELYWQYSGDDMDLHMLAPGGVPRTDTDCYYSNCQGGWGYLDWGVPGFAGDDPFLDLDDIPGTGPENINMDEPQAATYTVFVHDYPGSVYTGANNVTVNIYLGGALVWSDTRSISGEDSDNYFAQIDWAAGVVNGL